MSEDAFTPATEVGATDPQPDHLTIGCWIQDADAVWHASEHYDGPSGVHAVACDRTIGADQMGDVALEPIDPDVEDCCPDCLAAIDAADEVSGYV